MPGVLRFQSRLCTPCLPLVPVARPGVYCPGAPKTSFTLYKSVQPSRGSRPCVPFSVSAFRSPHTWNGRLRPSSMLKGTPRWVRTYSTPRNNYGYSQAEPKNTKFIWMIIVVNAAVFMAWQSVFMRNYPKRVPASIDKRAPSPLAAQELYKTLRKYFLLRVNDPKEGNYLSSLGSAFSHTDTMHFLGNMVTMFAFGTRVGAVPGIRIAHLAQLVVGSALCGSAGFVLFESREGSQTRNKAALGASGVVMGLGAAAFALVPRSTFLIYGIIPIQIGFLLPAYFVMDAYYLDDPKSRTAHSGHLGGAAFGLLFCALRFRGVVGIFGR